MRNKEIPTKGRNEQIGNNEGQIVQRQRDGVTRTVAQHLAASGPVLDQRVDESVTAHLNRISQNILIKEVSQYNRQANKETRKSKKLNQVDQQRVVQRIPHSPQKKDKMMPLSKRLQTLITPLILNSNANGYQGQPPTSSIEPNIQPLEPIIDQIKQAISTTSRTQTLDADSRSLNAHERTQQSNNQESSGLSNHGSVGSSVAEVNRSSAAGFAGGLIAGIIGANNVPNNRLDKAGGNWAIPSNQGSRYTKGMKVGKNRKASLNSNYSGPHGGLSGGIFQTYVHQGTNNRRKAAIHNKNYKSLQPKNNTANSSAGPNLEAQMRSMRQMDNMYTTSQYIQPVDNQIVSNSDPAVRNSGSQPFQNTQTIAQRHEELQNHHGKPYMFLNQMGQEGQRLPTESGNSSLVALNHTVDVRDHNKLDMSVNGANGPEGRSPTNQLNFSSIPANAQDRLKGSEDSSPNKRPNLNEVGAYQPNAKVSLNDMFKPKNTSGMVQLGMLTNNNTNMGNITGGPKLFIKQQSSSKAAAKKQVISQSDRPQNNRQMEDEINPLQQQQYQQDLIGFDTTQQHLAKLQSIDYNQQNHGSSHLEMYKSIPLKNFKNSRGNGFKHHGGQHQKMLSNNYQQIHQTLSGLQMRTNLNVSQNVPNNKKFNSISKSPARHRNNANSGNVTIISGARNRDTSLNSQKVVKEIQNHFKVSKKLSVQNNIQNSLVSNQIRLVSNQASLSQSQVGTIAASQGGGQISGKIMINKGFQTQNMQQIHSLKTRYGRKIKNSTSRNHSNNDPKCQNQKFIQNNFSRSINNLNEATMIQMSPAGAAHHGQMLLTNVNYSYEDIKHKQGNNKSLSQRPFQTLDSETGDQANSTEYMHQYKQQLDQRPPKPPVSSSLQNQKYLTIHKSSTSTGQPVMNRTVQNIKPKNELSKNQQQRSVQLSQLYQVHNNRDPQRREFGTLNASQPKRFRKNTNIGSQGISLNTGELNQNALNLQGVSRVNKNLSPISILDNSMNHQYVGNAQVGFPQQQLQYGDSQHQEDMDQADPKDDAKLPASESNQDLSYSLYANVQKGSKPINLTEHIRKANKIQIKKRFEQETQESLSPQQILNQANKLYDQNLMKKALKKYIEYIKLEPLDVAVHYRIGIIYASIGQMQNRGKDTEKGPLDIAQQNERTNSLEEALLHFEQVIKHNEHSKTIQSDISPKEEDSQKLSAKALFFIIRIHIELRDFYEANYQLDRAFHFGYHKGSEGGDDKDEVPYQIQMYRQLVQAVILLMKRKFDHAMNILKDIDTRVNSHLMTDSIEFQYMVFTYRAYGHITMKKYDLAIQDLESAKSIKNKQGKQIARVLDPISEFNRQIAELLKIKLNIFGSDPHISLQGGDPKLQTIVQISKQFPENKDIIRYHAIYLVQSAILFEVNASRRSSKNQFKIQMTKELKNLDKKLFQTFDKTQKDAMEKGIKKSRSHSTNLKMKPDMENSSIDKEIPDDIQNRFDEMVSTANIDHPLKNIIIRKAVSIVNKGLAFSPRDRNLLLARSTLNFYLHNFYEALCDVDAAIDLERASSGEDEPNATDLLHKGRCHACLSMFKEAITDFTKVIELDDELFDAYFFRGKCSYLIGDTSQAFLDFQKLILLQPKNPMVHAYAGNLLMTTGSYEDAAKAFSNADSVKSCAFAIYQRARCYLAVGDIKNAFSDLQKACSMYETMGSNDSGKKQLDYTNSHRNMIAIRDKECLENIIESIQLLRTAIQGKKIRKNRNDDGSRSETPLRKELKSEISYQSDMQYEQSGSSGCCIDREEKNTSKQSSTQDIVVVDQNATQSKTYSEHIDQFIQGLTQLIEIDYIELREIPAATGPQLDDNASQSELKSASEQFIHITQESRMHQQIIPNVNRIKIEKVRALRRLQAKQEQIYDNKLKKKKSTANLLVFNLDDEETDQQMKKDGLQICPWSYYMENLFSKDDLHLYRGVLNFYKQDYNAAIRDYKLSHKVKRMYKILDNEAQGRDSRVDEDASSDDPIDADLSDQLSQDDSDEFGDLKQSKEVEDDGQNESTLSEKTDLSDVGLCSLNKNEMLFNIILCKIKLKRYAEAKKLINRLLSGCPPKYRRDVRAWRDIVAEWVKYRKTNQSIEIAKETILIEPFKVEHRLCKFYPCVEFHYEDSNPEKSFPLGFLARPSFSFPFVKPPNMIPNVDETLLHNEFGPDKDEQNIPQPNPLWIKTLDVQPNSNSRTGKLLANKNEPAMGQQVQQHFQFTDTIVQQSDSCLSQSQSQSYISSQVSQLKHERQSKTEKTEKYAEIDDEIQVNYFAKDEKSLKMGENVNPIKTSTSELLGNHTAAQDDTELNNQTQNRTTNLSYSRNRISAQDIHIK